MPCVVGARGLLGPSALVGALSALLPLVGGCGGPGEPRGPAMSPPARTPVPPEGAEDVLRHRVAAGEAAVVHVLPPEAPPFPVGGTLEVGGGRWRRLTGRAPWSRHALARPIRHAAMAGDGLLAVDAAGSVLRFPGLGEPPAALGPLPPATRALVLGPPLVPARPGRGHRTLLFPSWDGVIRVDPAEGLRPHRDPTLTSAVELEGSVDGRLFLRGVDGSIRLRRAPGTPPTLVATPAPALGLGRRQGETVARLAFPPRAPGEPEPPPVALRVGAAGTGYTAGRSELDLALSREGETSNRGGVDDLRAERAMDPTPPGATPRPGVHPVGQMTLRRAAPLGDGRLLLAPSRRGPATQVVDAVTATLLRRGPLLPGEDCGPPVALGPGAVGLACGGTFYRSVDLEAFTPVTSLPRPASSAHAPTVGPRGDRIAYATPSTGDGPGGEAAAVVVQPLAEGAGAFVLRLPSSDDGRFVDDDGEVAIQGWDRDDHLLVGRAVVDLGRSGSRGTGPVPAVQDLEALVDMEIAFPGPPSSPGEAASSRVEAAGLTRDGQVWAVVRSSPSGLVPGGRRQAEAAPLRRLLVREAARPPRAEAPADAWEWTPWPGELPDGWRSVFLFSRELALAVGGSLGEVWRTVDGGAEWTKVPLADADLAQPPMPPVAFPGCGAGACLVLPREGVVGPGLFLAGAWSAALAPPPRPRVHAGGADAEPAPSPWWADWLGACLSQTGPTRNADAGSAAGEEDAAGPPRPSPEGPGWVERVGPSAWLAVEVTDTPPGAAGGAAGLRPRWRLSPTERPALGRPIRPIEPSATLTPLAAGPWGALVEARTVAGRGALFRWRRPGGAGRPVDRPEDLLRARAVGLGPRGDGSVVQLGFVHAVASWAGSVRVDLASYDPGTDRIRRGEAIVLDPGTALGVPWSAGSGNDDPAGLMLWDAAGRGHRRPEGAPAERWPLLDGPLRWPVCAPEQTMGWPTWRVLFDLAGGRPGVSPDGDRLQALELRLPHHAGGGPVSDPAAAPGAPAPPRAAEGSPCLLAVELSRQAAATPIPPATRFEARAGGVLRPMIDPAAGSQPEAPAVPGCGLGPAPRP